MYIKIHQLSFHLTSVRTAIIKKVNFREVEIKCLFMVNYDFQNLSVDILGRNKVGERENERKQEISKVLFCYKIKKTL